MPETTYRYDQERG